MSSVYTSVLHNDTSQVLSSFITALDYATKKSFHNYHSNIICNILFQLDDEKSQGTFFTIEIHVD